MGVRTAVYIRTAVYLRISPKPEENKEVLAIERQREICRKLCESRGWTPVLEYVDESVSAYSRKKRPAYTLLLADMAAGKIDAVVAWDLDRLHRQIIELEEFIELANRREIKLATDQGFVDISTPDGRMMARMKAVIARMEMEQKSKRQTAMYLQRALTGTYVGNRRPFGYLDNGDGTLTPHPVEGPIVGRLYREFTAGASMRGLVHWLNSEGITTTLGGQWSAMALKGMLKSPRNKGRRELKGRDVAPGQWEPLVDAETWMLAEAKMRKSAAKEQKTRQREGRYLLSGIALCGGCGSRLTGMGARPDHPTPVYRCAHQGCYRTTRSQLVADQVVVEALLERMTRPDAREALLYDNQVPQWVEHSDNIVGLEERLDELARQNEAGELSDRLYGVRAATVQEKLDAARAAVQKAEAAALYDEEFFKDPYNIWPTLPLARKRAILRDCLTVTLAPSKGQVTPGSTRPGFQPTDVQLTWLKAAA